MNVKIEDLMSKQVMTTTRSQTLGHVREVMSEHGIHALPVVGSEGEPLGILTSADLIDRHPDGARVSQAMSDGVVTVPAYAEPRVAARMMRNKHIHHLVVTHEQKVCGILSSYDLLRLVEDHSFRSRQAPTRSRRGHEREERKS